MFPYFVTANKTIMNNIISTCAQNVHFSLKDKFLL